MDAIYSVPTLRCGGLRVNIRERTIEYEKTVLCEFACRSGDTACARRNVAEPDCDIRTDFQRDRDRIIHCGAFRQLKHKTQVFLFPKSDHYRTRLTHTLEVAQIARTIARALRLNEDLTEAIALSHDLGHTPFGHDGERVLDRLCGFKHAEQSARVVEVIERNGKGLNLTEQVRDGIRNHASHARAATCEGDVVRLADKIAYINHDIEDAIHSGVLTNDDLPREAVEVLGNSKSKRITTLIMSAINAFDGTIGYDDRTAEAHDALRAFMFARVYNNPAINTEKEKAVNVVAFLYEHYCKNHDEMPELYLRLADEYGVERAVCDYISGMTDGFAVDLFKELCVPRAWGSR
ncbi:MAG: deoxyguanosinetriphosphate triphosphohydrolase [Oscillospiraceae bacterium]|nr:deoxyguanosinetriphosphate triphosphohydrolase [Oscillospiraceae bacterium]